jgi:hypothetical protein
MWNAILTFQFGFTTLPTQNGVESSDPLAAIANSKHLLKIFLVTTEVTPLKSCRIEGYTKCRRRLIEWFLVIWFPGCTGREVGIWK